MVHSQENGDFDNFWFHPTSQEATREIMEESVERVV